MEIIEEGAIRSASDITKLRIIDFRRLGYAITRDQAILSMLSFLVNHTYYFVLKDDLRRYPVREDWPGWRHPGNHPQLGHLYWNWFFSCHKGELTFADEPDFWGHYDTPNGKQVFWGDIGRVSVKSFLSTITNLEAGELWISILDHQTHVILQPLYSIREAWDRSQDKMLRRLFNATESSEKAVPEPVVSSQDWYGQLTLPGQVDEKGNLNVNLPSGIPPGRVVVQVLQPWIDFLGNYSETDT